MVRTFFAALTLGLFFAQPALAASTAAKKSSASTSKSWGALAYNSRSGAFGYAVDQASKRSAETEAFRQCGDDCDVVRSFRNACGAVAATGRRFAWETGASREIAEMKARKKCGAETCRVAAWACTRGK